MAKIEGITPEDLEQIDAPEETPEPTGEEITPDDEPLEDDTADEPGLSPEESEPDPEVESGESTEVEPTAPPVEETKAPAGYVPQAEVELLRRQVEEQRAFMAQFASTLRAPQAAPEKPKPWAAGVDDEEAMRAWRAVQGNQDALKALPGDLRERVTRVDRSIGERWTEYQADPGLFVRDHVIPMLERSRFAQELAELRGAHHSRVAQDYLGQHAKVVKSDEDRKELYALVKRGVPADDAVRLIAAERELAALKGKAVANAPKAAGQAAQRDKARLAMANKRGPQRPGKPGGGVPKNATLDDLVEIAKRRAKQEDD